MIEVSNLPNKRMEAPSQETTKANMGQMLTVSIADFKACVNDALRRNHNPEDAGKITDHTSFAQISNRPSHGIMPLVDPRHGILAAKPFAEPKVRTVSPFVSAIEGNGNPGILVGEKASETAIDLAKESGIGIVITTGSTSTSGCLAKYLLDITNADFIGMITSSTRPCVAPFGGIGPVLGTNPIAIGFPSLGDPFMLDMSTSSIPFNSVLEAAERNKRLPKGVAIDNQGNPTTSPTEAMKGALLPFNGHKGSALSLAVQLLAGVSSGAISSKDPTGNNWWGNQFLVINPSIFGFDIQSYKQAVTDHLNVIRNANQPGSRKVHIPGEGTLKTYRRNLEKGVVNVPRPLYSRLLSFSIFGDPNFDIPL